MLLPAQWWLRLNPIIATGVIIIARAALQQQQQQWAKSTGMRLAQYRQADVD